MRKKSHADHQVLYHSSTRKTIPSQFLYNAKKRSLSAAFSRFFRLYTIHINAVFPVLHAVCAQRILFRSQISAGAPGQKTFPRRTPPDILFFNCIYHTTHLRQTQYETYPKLTNDIFINCAVYDLNVQFSRIILNLQQKKTRGKRCPACPSVTEEKPVKSCCKCPGTS